MHVLDISFTANVEISCKDVSFVTTSVFHVERTYLFFMEKKYCLCFLLFISIFLIYFDALLRTSTCIFTFDDAFLCIIVLVIINMSKKGIVLTIPVCVKKNCYLLMISLKKLIEFPVELYITKILSVYFCQIINF